MRTKDNQFTQKLNAGKKAYVWNGKRRYNNLR
jgi:hypothetical protein